MNSWVHEQFEANPLLLEKFIKNGLLEELFKGMFNIHSSNPNSEFLTEFFVMIKSIICMCDIDIPKEVTEKLVSLMLKESLIYDTSISELTLSSLVLLMRYQDLPSYVKYLFLLKNAKNFEVSNRLIESISYILKDTNTKKNCQKNFVDAGILELLKEILENSFKDQNTSAVWVSAMECIRFLIQNNDYCRGKLSQICFKDLSYFLQTDLFIAKRQEICAKTIEILLYILFDTTNLDSAEAIFTPQVIPLILSMVCCSSSSFLSFILKSADSDYNAACFALNHSLEILIKNYHEIESFELLEFIEKMIEKVIPHHFSPLNMKAITAKGCQISLSKQLSLFKGVAQGLNKSLVKIKSFDDKDSNYRTNFTSYTLFQSPHSFIKFSSDTFDFLPKKDFTIVIWACPLSREKGSLMHFTDGKAEFIVSTFENSIEVLLVCEKKLVFKVVTNKKLIENQWNLVCITFQQITKILSTLCVLEVYINTEICEKTVEGKVLGISYNFSSLLIGNSNDLKSSFQGKIAACVVFSKFFSDFSIIYRLYDDYKLGFIPEAISIHQKLDVKSLKDLNKNKHIEYLSCCPNIETKGIEIACQATVINGSNIINSLNNLGGLKAFFIIFRESYSDQDLLIVMLQIISLFLRSNFLEPLISQDFFEILANTIEPLIVPTGDFLNFTKEMLKNLE